MLEIKNCKEAIQKFTEDSLAQSVLESILNAHNFDHHFKRKANVPILKKLTASEKYDIQKKLIGKPKAYLDMNEVLISCERVTFGLIEHTDTFVKMLSQEQKVEMFPEIYLDNKSNHTKKIF